ncbi:MAG: FkbM family methyltransferase [Terracidiphilus sp.]
MWKPKSSLDGLRAILSFDNWPMLLLERLFDRRAGFVVYRKNGLEILVDHRGGDCNGTRACIVTDMYPKYLTRLSLSGPNNVLDLGANGGGFPLLLRIMGIELGRVVCVEMNPIVYQRLAINLMTNLGPDAVALNAAVCGAKDSEIRLAPSRGDVGESMYDHQPDSEQRRLSVRTASVQMLYDQYFAGELIDLCKMDIESAEYEALEACPDRVLAKIRNLLIEFHDLPRTPALVARLQSQGFSEVGAEIDHYASPRSEVRAFRGPAQI